jgi:peroxiredoxin
MKPDPHNGAALEPLPAGPPAPDFRLFWKPHQTLALSSLRRRSVVVVFYPADWDPVSIEQLNLYQDSLSDFERFGAALLGISVDNVWTHAAFARESGLTFPLLADFEPKGAVARSFGVFPAEDGTSARALFVIDPAGVIRWSTVVPRCVNPGTDGILSALEEVLLGAYPSKRVNGK